MEPKKKKVAIIGSGIAGLTCAHYLHEQFDLTLFEANSYIGGHTNTVTVSRPDGDYAIDTGFIVFNPETYHHFVQLLRELNVPTQESAMHFSVRNDKYDIEYSSRDLGALFGHRKNLFSPTFLKMLSGMFLFQSRGKTFLDESTHDERTLQEFLDAARIPTETRDMLVLPMAASIWSTRASDVLNMPARFILQFLNNHHMLSTHGQPTWRVVQGGSSNYVKKLIAPLGSRVCTNTPIKRVERGNSSVLLYDQAGKMHQFNAVIFACHSPEVLKLLQDATDQEKEIIGAIKYSKNRAVLHTDTALLPSKRRIWSSWNYHSDSSDLGHFSMTYNMNILQSIQSQETFCVTVNPPASLHEEKILREIEYEHPLFDKAAAQAQKRMFEINGVNRTYFCGAYCRYGFHEDGVVSGKEVCRLINQNMH